jgi:hypothetical protein
MGKMSPLLCGECARHDLVARLATTVLLLL